MNVSVGNKRLLKLAAFLRELSPEKFDFAHWVGGDWKGDPSLKCGTTACAMGWATVVFRRQGLRLQRPNNVYEPVAPIMVDTKTGEVISKEGLSTAAIFFSLDREAATFLFVPKPSWSRERKPGSGATALQVAQHIEKFVAKRGGLMAIIEGVAKEA